MAVLGRTPRIRRDLSVPQGAWHAEGHVCVVTTNRRNRPCQACKAAVKKPGPTGPGLAEHIISPLSPSGREGPGERGPSASPRLGKSPVTTTTPRHPVPANRMHSASSRVRLVMGFPSLSLRSLQSTSHSGPRVPAGARSKSTTSPPKTQPEDPEASRQQQPATGQFGLSSPAPLFFFLLASCFFARVKSR